MAMDYMTVFVSIINFVIIIVLCVFSIYALILFVKLARRGIKALDIYIDEKNKDK